MITHSTNKVELIYIQIAKGCANAFITEDLLA